MKTTELIIAVLYVLACIAIGLWGRSKVRDNSSEYWISGRNINTFINSWAVLATLTSGGSILATPGTAFKLGLPYGASLVAGAIVGFSVASVLVARYLYNGNVFTIPEFLQKRYDNNRVIGLLTPLVILITNGIYIVSQLKATGLVISYIIGIPYLPALIVGTLVFIFYVSIGGMWAITYTDVLQGMLKAFIVLSLALIILSSYSWPSLFTSAVTAYPSIGTAQAAVPYASYLGGFLTWTLAVSVLPHLMMRVLTAKDQRSARLSLNWGMVIYAVVMTAANLVIVPAVSLLPPDVIKHGVSDEFMLLLGDKFFNPVLRGLLVAAVMAAVMSATAGLLLASTSSFVHDVYKKYLQPEASDREIVRVAFITTWVIGIITILLSIHPPAYLVVLYTAAVAFLASTLFGPVVLGIWWKRMNPPGAIAGILVGGIVFWVVFALPFPPSTQILIALPCSILSSVIVSLATAKPSESQIRFQQHIHGVSGLPGESQDDLIRVR